MSIKTYFILLPTGLVKIGKSQDVRKRMGSLSITFEKPLLLLTLFEGDRELEFHRQFRAEHVNKELFNLSDALRDFILQNGGARFADVLNAQRPCSNGTFGFACNRIERDWKIKFIDVSGAKDVWEFRDKVTDLGMDFCEDSCDPDDVELYGMEHVECDELGICQKCELFLAMKAIAETSQSLVAIHENAFISMYRGNGSSAIFRRGRNELIRAYEHFDVIGLSLNAHCVLDDGSTEDLKVVELYYESLLRDEVESPLSAS